MSKWGSGCKFDSPQVSDLRFSIAKQEYPGPSRNLVDQHYPKLVFQTAMLVLRPYGIEKGVGYALSARNDPSGMAQGRSKLVHTDAVLPRASCTSAFFRVIVQSNFFSISSRSRYICESTDN